jgi:hypothetical protein
VSPVYSGDCGDRDFPDYCASNDWQRSSPQEVRHTFGGPLTPETSGMFRCHLDENSGPVSALNLRGRRAASWKRTSDHLDNVNVSKLRCYGLDDTVVAEGSVLLRSYRDLRFTSSLGALPNIADSTPDQNATRCDDEGGRCGSAPMVDLVVWGCIVEAMSWLPVHGCNFFWNIGACLFSGVVFSAQYHAYVLGEERVQHLSDGTGPNTNVMNFTAMSSKASRVIVVMWALCKTRKRAPKSQKGVDD